MKCMTPLPIANLSNALIVADFLIEKFSRIRSIGKQSGLFSHFSLSCSRVSIETKNTTILNTKKELSVCCSRERHFAT